MKDNQSSKPSSYDFRIETSKSRFQARQEGMIEGSATTVSPEHWIFNGVVRPQKGSASSLPPGAEYGQFSGEKARRSEGRSGRRAGSASFEKRERKISIPKSANSVTVAARPPPSRASSGKEATAVRRSWVPTGSSQNRRRGARLLRPSVAARRNVAGNGRLVSGRGRTWSAVCLPTLSS